MQAKTYTILANGDGSFSVQINYGDFAAETWALNNKHPDDTVARE